MEFESNVISKEIIKPSSPTPKSLQKHQLSFIDQIAPLFLAPVIYFYSSDSKIPNSQKTNHLKKSLSETLSRFYPLAGRLVDNLYVDCTDDGVPFVEALADCDLSQVITNPDLNTIKKRLLYNSDGSQFFFLAVQVTHFRCGGLAVAILLSHKIADALSIVTFANTWSAVARNGGGGIPLPKFDGATLFPPVDIPSLDVDSEEIVSKTFTFSAEKISLLQEKYSAATCGRRPGRVEVLTAYISTRLVSATGMLADPTKTYFLNHQVNLRSRIDPPKFKHNFGNFAWIVVATPTAGDGVVEVLQKLREAKRGMSKEYVPQLKDLSHIIMAQPDKGDRVVIFNISSLCGFPLYGADFGWGEPAWAVFVGVPVGNVAILTDAKSGGGIEAVINLRKEEMEKLEVDMELSMLKSNL